MAWGTRLHSLASQTLYLTKRGKGSGQTLLQSTIFLDQLRNCIILHHGCVALQALCIIMQVRVCG